MHASRLTVLGLVMIATLPGWGCGGSAGPGGGGTNPIPPFLVFVAENDIWGMRANGDSLARYTLNPPGSVQYPAALSHDGLEIVFPFTEDAGVPGLPTLWIMDFGGGNRRPLAADVDGGPVYGHTVTFASDDTGVLIGRLDAQTVSLYDRATGALTALEVVGYHPSASPDGSRVAFQSAGACEGYGLVVQNLSAPLAAQALCASDMPLCSPAWSPGGTQIAFDNDPSLGGGGSPDSDIYLTAFPPGSGEFIASTRLTTYGDARHPSFSPGGGLIAFQRGNDVWVMNADGSEPENLTNGEVVAEYPRFAGSP